MDGGTVWNVNIRSAIEGCLEVVDDLSKITIDIIFCTDGRDNQEITETGTTVENYLRYRKIKYVHSGHDELTELLRSYPTVNWRYLFMEPYPGGAGGAKQLDFSPEITWPLQLIGRQHALDALAYGPGYGFDKLLGKIVE